MKRNLKYVLSAVFLLWLVYACRKDERIPETRLPEDVAEMAKWYGRQLLPNDNPQAFANMNKPDWNGTVVKKKGDSTLYTTLILTDAKSTRELQVTYYDGSYIGLVRQYEYVRKDSIAVGTFTINGRMLDIGYFDESNKYTLKAVTGKRNIVLMGTELPVVDVYPPGTGGTGTGGTGTGGTGTGGTGTPPTGTFPIGTGGSVGPSSFNSSNLVNTLGNKPLKEFRDKCTGLQFMWNNYPNNETFGYLTADNQLIMTDVLALDGGQASGTYKYVNPDGTTSYYFTYPDTQGAPAGTYTGIIHSAGKYFIPITASIHTHTPCRQDGTNGVSHNVGADDKAFATSAPGLKHWVIGCGAIGQFNSTSTNFFNILVGDLSTNCSKIN